MRLIPGKTKVQIELFKGISLADMLVGGVGLLLFVLVLASSLPGKIIWMCAVVLVTVLLILRIDTEPNYLYILHILVHMTSKLRYSDKKEKSSATGADMSEIMPFTDIKDGIIHYGGEYYGAAIEISPTEFRFFSEGRRKNSVENSVGRIIRSIASDYSFNIVKLERPMLYDEQLENEEKKLEILKKSFENGVITEKELLARAEIVHSRIDELKTLCFDEKILGMFYYIVLFDGDKGQLNNTVSNAVDTLASGEIQARRLDDRELAVFLRYTNEVDFDEREIADVAPEDYARWAMPKSVDVRPRYTDVNGIIAHNMRVVNYPMDVGDAWLASVMSVPGTKVVVKAKPTDRTKAIRGIDHSLTELRGQLATTGLDSKRIELQAHIDSLSELLVTLQGDNESLLDTNVYITAYDYQRTKTVKGDKAPVSIRPAIGTMKRMVRRAWSEANMRLNNMEFCQLDAFIASQISAYDPLETKGRGMPSNTVAAMYPWVFPFVNDKKGIMLGSSDGMPVFVDFFRRDSERVNSNMVIVGKSGSGKSYAAKSILTNLAADESKVFILDPENEYSELAANMHGKFINVGNAKFGRLNPFHVITALDDDDNDGGTDTGSYATHLQFLEEFYRQILPDCEKDAMEYLNSLTDRMYTNKGINSETDLTKLRPEDYPTFDDLYDTILSEFQSTDNVYVRTILRALMNYISKFSSGGRNAQIWNGPSSITTEENFTVFNFQSLLANRNGTIANAQMLLVLKYIDNEIIKNRDYNIKNKANRKIIVVIDEAHVFIDTKYPAALDFMFQLAKRIRKYNGMQIVITQNIKDFVGSEEIARKSTAIINACQYSFIFPLAPNDMDDLCRLYEKAGGINEVEQEQIVGSPRGTAFVVMSAQSRSTVHIDSPDNIVSTFREAGYEGQYFSGEEGAKFAEDYIGDSRASFEKNRVSLKNAAQGQQREQEAIGSHVVFVEYDEDEADKAYGEPKRVEKAPQTPEIPDVEAEDDIPVIPDDPAEFLRMQAERDALRREKEAAVAAKQPVTVVRETERIVETKSSSRTEEILSELVGKLSLDSIRNEIRQTVREELALRNIQPQPEAPVEAPVMGMSASGTDTQTTAAEPAAEAQVPETEAPAQEAQEAAPEQIMEELSFSFSVDELLKTQANRLSSVTLIDLMEDYDQSSAEISLNDLIQYNNKKKS